MGSINVNAQHPICPPTAKLCVERVGLEYETKGGKTMVALKDVSLSVPENEFAVIVGPSGCGKSSLLYLAAGLAEPTYGQIKVGQKVVEGPGPDRGMVFQGYTLFPWLTVSQNIEFGLKRRGLSGKECQTIVQHYLNEVGLTAFATSFPKQLSGGMMQRVAIARALANDPELLLMDEPFGALDSQTRSQMQSLLLKVWEHKKKTVLFVTHDIDEAILLGDSVYVMTGRPGSIRKHIRVPIARPRSLDMVMDRAFIDVKREILGLLHSDAFAPAH